MNTKMKMTMNKPITTLEELKMRKLQVRSTLQAHEKRLLLIHSDLITPIQNIIDFFSKKEEKIIEVEEGKHDLQEIAITVLGFVSSALNTYKLFREIVPKHSKPKKEK